MNKYQLLMDSVICVTKMLYRGRKRERSERMGERREGGRGREREAGGNIREEREGC
jgi:hypothetical protein